MLTLAAEPVADGPSVQIAPFAMFTAVDAVGTPLGVQLLAVNQPPLVVLFHVATWANVGSAAVNIARSARPAIKRRGCLVEHVTTASVICSLLDGAGWCCRSPTPRAWTAG